ncbi:thioesterase domain-containing protein [Aspergillus glaucus CBS 516.65]|uniref:Thioesterase domain-containing protein n=1 Tax=Aspergillus glaucus CBS 516.65 TaxID=1160497 RepID=A0A1L9V5R8_ASPGL|nr:hypothetical protein ASPGLDRAFT_40131 [Aspergillus glaucus CBS 516.65]OJJ79270.1 hypothetical protein ASPGLDRAFT_40131 [Aspergillus glaucus CBS 516.65]
MANDHVSLIRRAQPHGPYYICGFSFGANVALEVSHRLRQENETVHLIIIDAHVNYRPPLPSQITRRALREVVQCPNGDVLQNTRCHEYPRRHAERSKV